MKTLSGEYREFSLCRLSGRTREKERERTVQVCLRINTQKFVSCYVPVNKLFAKYLPNTVGKLKLLKQMKKFRSKGKQNIWTSLALAYAHVHNVSSPLCLWLCRRKVKKKKRENKKTHDKKRIMAKEKSSVSLSLPLRLT